MLEFRSPDPYIVNFHAVERLMQNCWYLNNVHFITKPSLGAIQRDYDLVFIQAHSDNDKLKNITVGFTYNAIDQLIITIGNIFIMGVVRPAPHPRPTFPELNSGQPTHQSKFVLALQAESPPCCQ
jgi:hypothetical protein